MAAFYDVGNYNVICTGSSLGENKKGNPELQIRFKPTHQLADNGEPVALPLTWERTIYLTFTEATMGTESEPGWVLQTIAALGFTGQSFGDLEKHNFTGTPFQARCEHDEWDGKEKEKWSVNRARTPKPVKPVEKKTLRTLDAKFGKALKAASAGVTAPPLPPPPADRQEADIPF